MAMAKWRMVSVASEAPVTGSHCRIWFSPRLSPRVPAVQDLKGKLKINKNIMRSTALASTICRRITWWESALGGLHWLPVILQVIQGVILLVTISYCESHCESQNSNHPCDIVKSQFDSSLQQTFKKFFCSQKRIIKMRQELTFRCSLHNHTSKHSEFC